MHLDNDVYTAVLHDWDDTVKIARSFGALETWLAGHDVGQYFRPVPRPGLLYGLNTAGLYAKPGPPGDRSSPEFQNLQHQVKVLEKQGRDTVQTIFSAMNRSDQRMEAISARLDNAITTMTTLAANHALTSQIFHYELRISSLQQERSSCELMLSFEHISAQTRERSAARALQCSDELDNIRRKVDELHAQQASLNYHDHIPLPIADARPTPATSQATSSAQPVASGSSAPSAPGPFQQADHESDDEEVQDMVTPMDITPQ